MEDTRKTVAGFGDLHDFLLRTGFPHGSLNFGKYGPSRRGRTEVDVPQIGHETFP
jgi:hypothetical protein